MTQARSAAAGVRAAFPVVGIGASAGGIQALEALFTALGHPSGLAVVVVLHLPAARKSELATMIERWSGMPACNAGDGMRLEPGRVYVGRGGEILSLQGGVLGVRRAEPGLRRLDSIDRCMESLAADLGDRAIAVILSGSAADGAAGALKVRQAGGRVLVQDPRSAQHDSMPLAAIASGAASLVMPPEAIARELRALVSPPAGTAGARAPASASARGNTRRGPAQGREVSREEMQSLDDEMQSLGEELRTVHDQLTLANDDLAHASALLQDKVQAMQTQDNVLSSGAVMAMLLDQHLHVRWATPAMIELFPLRAGDGERPITDLAPRINDPSFAADVRAVLATQEPREAEAQAFDGRWFARHVRPYRSGDGRIGVAVNFHDITALKRDQQDLRADLKALQRTRP